MLFYIIYLFSVYAIMYFLRKKKTLMFFACFLCLFLLLALKGEGMGADYEPYRRYFELYKNLDFKSILSVDVIESGYVLLTVVVGKIGGGYHWEW